MNKPRTQQAMAQLIASIREQIPFDDLNQAGVCSRLCNGCPKKRLEYLEQEADYWAREITAGQSPNLGDVNKLARSSQKIHQWLIKKPDLANE